MHADVKRVKQKKSWAFTHWGRGGGRNICYLFYILFLNIFNHKPFIPIQQSVQQDVPIFIILLLPMRFLKVYIVGNSYVYKYYSLYNLLLDNKLKQVSYKH